MTTLSLANSALSGFIRRDFLHNFTIKHCDKIRNTIKKYTARIMSAVGKHNTPGLSSQFSILKKCKAKFDCVLYEIFLIKELKPSHNT